MTAKRVWKAETGLYNQRESYRAWRAHVEGTREHGVASTRPLSWTRGIDQIEATEGNVDIWLT